MFSKSKALIIDEIHKTSYIQNVIDTATELNRITTNIRSDMQLVISYAENELKHFNDAKDTAEKILTVFLSSEENINTARHNFLNTYHLWLEECLKITADLSRDQLSKTNEQKKQLSRFKSIQNKSVVELEDSSASDLEIINEIKYLNSYKLTSDNEEDELISKTTDKESRKTLKLNSDNALEDLNLATDAEGNNGSLLMSEDSRGTTKLNDDEDVRLEKNEFSKLFIDSGLNNVSETVNKKNSNNESNISSDKVSKSACTFDLKNNSYYLLDEKLRLKCIVLLKCLPKQTLNKYRNKFRSKKLLDDDEFLRLIDLSALEKPRNKRCYISSESSSTTKSSSSSRTKSYKEKRKNKKQRICSSENEISSFYSSSDDDGTKYNNNYVFSEHSDIEKLLLQENEERFKQALLRSDDSTDDECNEDDKDDKDDKNDKDYVDDEDDETSSCNDEQKKNKKKCIDKSDADSSSTEEESNERSSWLKDKLLHFKLMDSENNKTKKNTNTVSCEKEESESASEMVEPFNKKKKRKTRKKSLQIRPLISSDTDSSSTNNSNHSSASEDCLIVNGDSQLSEDSVILENTNNNSEVVSIHLTPSKPAGRRNIRKLLDDQDITEGTKQAAKEEDNRLQRLDERKHQLQALLRENSKEKDSLILDFDTETKGKLIKVDRGLVKYLKPHQAEGVKFMWDSCFETLERARNTEGSGCVLAHCMGLGKTFQIVSLVHTVLANKATGVNTVMVVCPMSTILNWVDEFHIWLDKAENKNKVRVYELTQLKTMSSRIAQLKFWHELGGVLIISYDMYRSFTSEKRERKLSPSQMKRIKLYLMTPGADLVVCDEGHLLKNEDSILANKIQSVKTKRRIILTGTPLQNNLSEYHCMVQIVKPNLLGTKNEFLNRFSNPITNGQFDNSTPHDVKLMKHRAHVLHRMLEGCVQRRDYAVLTPFLPPKQEYVILIRLSELQIEMYKHFIEKIAKINTKHCSLFKNYHEIKRLVAHPNTMQLKTQTKKKSSHHVNSQTSRNSFREAVEDFWWSRFVTEEHLQDLTKSYKLVLLFGILERCEKEGDKLLVFSQCLHTLDVIENFLKVADAQSKPNGTNGTNGNLFNFQGEWKCGLDYFRLDGTVNSDKRNSACKTFNNPANKRARLFLISTKAGGLGINLIGANRVVIFDPSWNPSNDVQSIFRIFRFGQEKPCYVYRFLTAGTMEQKIYNRQVTKLSLSLRVLDEQQIERHYRDTELAELYQFEPLIGDVPILNLPRDHVLADVFLKFKAYVYNFFEHDSLLENKEEEELDEDERKQAWHEYQQEKLTQQNTGKLNQRKRMPDRSTTEQQQQPAVAEDSPGVNEAIEDLTLA